MRRLSGLLPLNEFKHSKMKYDIASRRRQRQSRTTPKNTVPVTPEWIPPHGIPEDIVEDGDDAPAPLVPVMPHDTGK